MKLKYLLHGIGIGLFTAGCISLIVFATAGRMSDEQIIKRAKELGYVPQTEATSELVQLTSENPAKEADSKTGVVTEEITPPGVKTSEEASEKASEKTSVKTSEDVKAEEEAKKKAEEEAAKKAEEEAKKKAEEEEAKKKAEEEAKKKAEEEAAKKAEEEAKKKAEEEAKQQQQPKGETVTITIQSGQFSESVSEACEKAGLVKSATEFDKYLCDNGYSGRLAVGEHKIAKGSSFEEIAKALCAH